MKYDHDKEIAEIWGILKASAIQTQEIKAMFQETNQQFKETDKKFKDTEKKIKSLAKLFEDQWGRLMEALVEGGVLELFKKQNISVNEVHQRVRTKQNGKHMEIDLLLENGSEVIIVEVKTTLRPNHVEDFLERLALFPQFFKKYKTYTIYGAMTALRIDQASDRYAAKNGLFVIKIGSDNLITLLNDINFVPKKFQPVD